MGTHTGLLLIRGWLGVYQPGEQGLVVEALPDEGVLADECFFGWELVAFVAEGLTAEGVAACAGHETGAGRPAVGFALVAGEGFVGEGLVAEGVAACAAGQAGACRPEGFALAAGGVAACAGQETGAGQPAVGFALTAGEGFVAEVGLVGEGLIADGVAACAAGQAAAFRLEGFALAAEEDSVSEGVAAEGLAAEGDIG